MIIKKAGNPAFFGPDNRRFAERAFYCLKRELLTGLEAAKAMTVSAAAQKQ